MSSPLTDPLAASRVKPTISRPEKQSRSDEGKFVKDEPPPEPVDAPTLEEEKATVVVPSLNPTEAGAKKVVRVERYELLQDAAFFLSGQPVTWRKGRVVARGSYPQVVFDALEKRGIKMKRIE